jgi:hypothetical protein
MEVSLGKKLNEISFQQMSQKLWCASVIPAMWKAEIGESSSKADPRKKHETLSEK